MNLKWVELLIMSLFTVGRLTELQSFVSSAGIMQQDSKALRLNVVDFVIEHISDDSNGDTLCSTFERSVFHRSVDGHSSRQNILAGTAEKAVSPSAYMRQIYILSHRRGLLYLKAIDGVALLVLRNVLPAVFIETLFYKRCIQHIWHIYHICKCVTYFFNIAVARNWEKTIELYLFSAEALTITPSTC